MKPLDDSPISLNDPRTALRLLDALKLIKLEALSCTDSAAGLAHIVRLCIDAGVIEHIEELQAFKRKAILDAVFTPLDRP